MSLSYLFLTSVTIQNIQLVGTSIIYIERSTYNPLFNVTASDFNKDFIYSFQCSLTLTDSTIQSKIYKRILIIYQIRWHHKYESIFS